MSLWTGTETSPEPWEPGRTDDLPNDGSYPGGWGCIQGKNFLEARVLLRSDSDSSSPVLGRTRSERAIGPPSVLLATDTQLLLSLLFFFSIKKFQLDSWRHTWGHWTPICVLIITVLKSPFSALHYDSDLWLPHWNVWLSLVYWNSGTTRKLPHKPH